MLPIKNINTRNKENLSQKYEHNCNFCFQLSISVQLVVILFITSILFNTFKVIQVT